MRERERERGEAREREGERGRESSVCTPLVVSFSKQIKGRPTLILTALQKTRLLQTALKNDREPYLVSPKTRSQTVNKRSGLHM